MFALALFDRIENTLLLARDAFGEKPLYYALHQKALLFGSELKALRAVASFKPEMNLHATADFFKYSYVPAPTTIHSAVFKLPPASFIKVNLGQIERMDLPKSEEKAIWEQSLDQEGCWSSPIVSVIRVCPVPSPFITKIS